MFDNPNDLELIIGRLESIEEKVDGINEKFHERHTKTEVQIAELRVKSGFWGLIGGILSGLILYLTAVFRK